MFTLLLLSAWAINPFIIGYNYPHRMRIGSMRTTIKFGIIGNCSIPIFDRPEGCIERQVNFKTAHMLITLQGFFEQIIFDIRSTRSDR